MRLPTSDPIDQGVDASGIAALVATLEADPGVEPHGLIVQRHGHRIAEGYWAPHSPDRLRLVYSLSKSFTATALALQVGEGRLSLDDLVADHLPSEMAGADEVTRSLRIRHIASMSTGHDHEMLMESFAADPDDLLRGFFRLPPPHEPGTRFAYSQPPVVALATILQNLAGERLSTYLGPRLLEPLGIADLRSVEVRPGIEPGFTGVYTNLDAVARLGQLYLDDGVWNGERVLPEGWVAQASRPQVANAGEPNPDWQQGYGFGLWMSRHGYRGDGAFGQLMIVLPDDDVVVAMFTASLDFQALMDHVWTHLLPAVDPHVTPSGDADADLARSLSDLALPTAQQRLGGSGPASLTMHCEPASVGPTTHHTVTAIDLDGDRMRVHELDVVIDVPLHPDWTRVPGHAIAASTGIDDAGRIAVDLVFLDTPHRLTVTVDPASSTFDASWPAVPLFRAGLEPQLASMTMPPVAL